MNIIRRYGTSPQQRCADPSGCPDILALDTGDYLIIGKTPGVPNISARDLTKHGASIGPDEQAVIVPRDVVHAAAAEIMRAAWTPPPPGDTREQLPDHILNIIRPHLPDYTSTACQTGKALAEAIADRFTASDRETVTELQLWRERMRQRCRANQKFTGQLCVAEWHTEQPSPADAEPVPATPIVDRPFRSHRKPTPCPAGCGATHQCPLHARQT